MDRWVERALKEVPAAQEQEDLALRNSLPEYISQLVDALSTTIDRRREELSILFQQYRRLRGSDVKQGWGLGLAVVKGIVDAHRGSVEVSSEEGQGTTFTVRLPKQVARA
jgi:signal transduction histidine kinase